MKRGRSEGRARAKLLPEINALRHSFYPWRVIAGIDGNELLSQLVEQLDVVLVGVQFGVEVLLEGNKREERTSKTHKYFIKYHKMSMNFQWGRQKENKNHVQASVKLMKKRYTNLLFLLLWIESGEVQNIGLSLSRPQSFRSAFHPQEPCLNFLSLRLISARMWMNEAGAWRIRRKCTKKLWKINKLIDFWCFYLWVKEGESRIGIIET